MICQGCKKEFDIRYDHQKYCSRNCAKREEKRRAAERLYGVFDKCGRCERCGVEFEKQTRNQKYCSVSCKELDRKENPELKQRHAENTRRWREAHPECVAKDRERLNNTRWKYRRPAVVHICSNCGEGMNKRKSSICKDCEKRAKELRKAEKAKVRTKYPFMRFVIQRYLARIKGLPADYTRKDWLKTLEFFGYKCAYCGCEGELHQDHFFPSSKGGGYTKNNIVPACQSCNSRKGNIEPEYWLPIEKYRYIASYLGAR